MNAMGVYSVVVARSGQPATGRATEVALLCHTRRAKQSPDSR
jgi:pantothenate kinase